MTSRTTTTPGHARQSPPRGSKRPNSSNDRGPFLAEHCSEPRNALVCWLRQCSQSGSRTPSLPIPIPHPRDCSRVLISHFIMEINSRLRKREQEQTNEVILRNLTMTIRLAVLLLWVFKRRPDLTLLWSRKPASSPHPPIQPPPLLQATPVA